jgi:hypothetical protein
VDGQAYQYPAVMPGGLGEDVVAAVGDLAQVLDGFVEVQMRILRGARDPWSGEECPRSGTRGVAEPKHTRHGPLA